MSFHFSRCIVLWAILVNTGCNAPQSAHKVEEKITPQIAATPAQQPTDGVTESMPKGLFDQDGRAKEAWLRFQADGRYRMARPDDFQIPKAVMKDNVNNPFFTNKFAYVGGDFNRDGHLLDRAFIVIDTTSTPDKRFGIVVFNAPGDDGLPSVHWVFKDLDLSKSVLSAATDVLSLTEYHEDGTQEVCNVRWHKKRAEYSCEKSG
jgi:hypothetical protein